jgi:hypothetical protein
MTKAFLQQRSILTMGLPSNLRSSPTKRCKTFAFKRIPASSNNKATKPSQQRNLHGELVRRVDQQGTLKCIKCEKKTLGKECRRPHHITCSHSDHCNGASWPTSGARTRGAVEKTAKTNIANNTRKLDAHQKGGKENPTRRADGVTFFGALRPAASPSSPPSTADNNESSRANKDDIADSCPLSRDTLKVEMQKRIKLRQSSKSAAANINSPLVKALVDLKA